MMYFSKKFKLIFISIVFAIFASAFLLEKQLFFAPVKDTASLYPLTMSGWETYENTAYHYRISHPSTRKWVTPDQYGELSLSSEVSFGGDISGLTIQTGRAEHDKDYEDIKDARTKVLMAERYKLLSAGVKDLAENIRQYQINDPNPYVHGKKVGPLEETMIGGRKAYTFTLTESFGGSLGGYLIGSNPHLYIITDNPSGDKFIIHYLVGDPISEMMIQTFKFTP